MPGVLAPAMQRVRLERLGLAPYLPTVEAMRKFSARRGADTPDELWLLEHPPVYTLGLGADPAHGPRADNGIAVQRVERGGQVTYHGPGQVVLYALVDIGRRGLGVREFVAMLEQSVIDLLAEHGVRAVRKPGAPGVYVDGAKIAALGLRVSRGRTFHGLALNVDVDLAPFAAIDPCGYPGLRVTRLRDLGVMQSCAEAGERLAEILLARLAHA
ncbi:MAG TPA: lipoyl(octanoyl) transferase LipB [Burkholderiales bacterium]|nr:lipoyl(octanoyl) transferase LipB [Burkholderiales bacterium]